MNRKAFSVVGLKPDEILDQHVREGGVEVVLHISKPLAHRGSVLNNIAAARHPIAACAWEIPLANGSATSVQLDILRHVIVEQLAIFVADTTTRRLVVSQIVGVGLVDDGILKRPSSSVPAVGRFVEKVVSVLGRRHAKWLLKPHFIIELFPCDIKLNVIRRKQIEVPGRVANRFTNKTELISDTTGMLVVTGKA